MDDMKSLFAKVLDEPGPPMASGELLLARARRVRRRHRLVRTTAASAVLAAAVFGVTVLPGGFAALGRSSPAAGSATVTAVPSEVPAGTAEPSPMSPAAAPTPSEIGGVEITAGPQYDAALAMVGALTGALPAGYAGSAPPVGVVVSGPRGSGAWVWGYQSGYVYSVTVNVSRDGQTGMVAVYADRGSSALRTGGSMCAQPIPYLPADSGCTIVTSRSGTAVRLSWSGTAGGQGGSGGQTYSAVVAYPEVTVIVRESTCGVQSGPPCLSQPVFTQRELAELAASPELRP